MKFNKWTLGLAAVGAVSLASAVRADEAKLSPLQTALSNTTISGYVDVAAQYNLGNSAFGYNSTPVTTSGHSGMLNGFSLNSADIAIDKPQDESPWASGYHIELNAGQDSINALGGLTYTRNGSPVTWMQNSGSVAIRQAYVALRTPVGNGIDWKIGAFDGITGYEGNTGYANPNYTRSYGYAVNPATEVGILASYKICNAVSVQAGMANRGNNVNNGEYFPTSHSTSSHDYIASIALTAPDSWGFLKGSTLNLQTVQGFDSGSVNNYSVNGTFATPVAGLKIGLAYDKVQGEDYYNQHMDGNIYGVYATYQATQKLGINLRGEYIDGQNFGFLYGNNGKGEEVTATLEYDLWANVISRLEFRWDHCETGTEFNYNNTENAFLLALNVVYKF